jgi:hypothetical protein
MIQTTLPRAAPQPLDLNALAQQALQPWADAFDTWRTGMDSWNTGVANVMRSAKTNPQASCGCPVCAPDPCSCKCCVSDADLVIEARVGERRIVPVIIENKWRRERDIEVELSSWTKVSDTVEIKAEILGDHAFKLAPCGQAQVVLVVNVAVPSTVTPVPAPAPAPAPDPTRNPTAPNKATGKAATVDQPVATPAPVGVRQIPDVDRCLVSYADLRIKGCDLRSVRIAVAILPRDCEAFTVDCGCSCCC